MFDETVAKKGSIETVSFLWHFIKKYIRSSVTVLHIFTDNCGGRIRMLLWSNSCQIWKTRFSKIVHHLPEPDHSFLPCYRDFAQIEKKKRKKEILYLPEEWYSLVENCGKKFTVERFILKHI